MAEPLTIDLPGPEDTAALGGALASAIRHVAPAQLGIDLEGELGAGKSSLARSLLAGLGHRGRVPSPTYTLVEPYAVGGYAVFHVDLYRLSDPAELEYLGLTDELGEGTLLVTEWPERGLGRLPPPDLRISLAPAGSGRLATLYPVSAAGEALCTELRHRRPLRRDPS